MASKNEAPPSLFIHAKSMYEEMFKSAEREMTDEDSEQIVYTGFLVKLVTQGLNLSIPNFTTCRKVLMDMDCIRQIKRGGGSGKSIWELKKAPTLEDFYMITTNKELPKQIMVNGRQQRDIQIQELNERVNALEEIIQNIIKEE